MTLFMKVVDSVRRNRRERENDARLVRAIPGVACRSPLELRVQEILAARLACPWDHVVAKLAEYLRGCNGPSVLASLDEGVWGRWVWPAVAREELRRLEGIIVQADASSPDQEADRIPHSGDHSTGWRAERRAGGRRVEKETW